MEKYIRCNMGQEEGAAFEPGTDLTAVVLTFERGAFGGGGGTDGVGTSWETRSGRSKM